MNEFFSQLKEQFERLDVRQRKVIAAAAALCIVILIVSLAWAGRREWRPLFDGPLPQNEAGRVSKSLDDMNIDYRLDEDGSTILVPAQDRGRITMQLAQTNSLPNPTIGWTEILSESSVMGRTREREKLDFTRGLQGELERTIRNQIKPVRNVRVHITLPEVRLFLEDQVPPSASIAIELNPYEDINDEQVRGIMNLVAYAVEGLEPANVKIIDNYGRTISDRVEFEKTDHSRAQTVLEIQREYENELARKTQSMLARVLGEDKVIVRVAVEFDFDKIESTIRQFAPPIEGEDVGILRSQETDTEAYEGKGAFPGGVPGVDTNIPGYKAIDSEHSIYDRRRAINNYEINSTEKHLIKSPGTVKRLTVSVLVDDQYELTEDQKLALEDNVKAALGFISGRDEIKFTQIRFSTDALDRLKLLMEAEARRQMLINIAIIIAATMFLFGWLLLRWLKERREARLRAISEQIDEEEVVDLEESFEPVISIEEQEKREIQERLRRHAQDNPEQVAQLLKAWIIEEA